MGVAGIHANTHLRTLVNQKRDFSIPVLKFS